MIAADKNTRVARLDRLSGRNVLHYEKKHKQN